LSLSAFRGALRSRRGLWRNILITLAVVASIVVGLLAMHSLNLDYGHSDSTVASASHHGTAMTAGDARVSAADDCGYTPCTPEHSMMAMACILALLISVLLIGTIRMVTVWRPLRDGVVSLHEPWASLPMPIPPSLHALCISRT
jgi:Family of unknown function (DUF6153)